MKVVFDSEEQKEEVVRGYCVMEFSGDDSERMENCMDNMSCLECWEKHIEMEVKENE